MSNVLQLFPKSGLQRPLSSLYLEHDLREIVATTTPFVFTNFVASLDGRIAVRTNASWKIPPQIKTEQDQSLYQQLSAQADVIIITSRHARAIVNNDQLQPFPFTENQDDSALKQWRLKHGRSALPAIVVVCRSLNFQGEALRRKLDCALYCVTGSDAAEGKIRQMQNEGVTVAVASQTALVSGASLVSTLAGWGFKLVYSVAGPVLMNALLQDQVLDRLYLTQVEVLAGGDDFVTLGDSFKKSPDGRLELGSLFRCKDGHAAGQLFSAYDVHYDTVDRPQHRHAGRTEEDELEDELKKAERNPESNPGYVDEQLRQTDA